jgi:hypothetical protein
MLQAPWVILFPSILHHPSPFAPPHMPLLSFTLILNTITGQVLQALEDSIRKLIWQERRRLFPTASRCEAAMPTPPARQGARPRRRAATHPSAAACLDAAVPARLLPPLKITNATPNPATSDSVHIAALRRAPSTWTMPPTSSPAAVPSSRARMTSPLTWVTGSTWLPAPRPAACWRCTVSLPGRPRGWVVVTGS